MTISNAQRARGLIMCAAFVLGAWACEQTSKDGAGTSSSAGAGGIGQGPTLATSGQGGGIFLLDAGAGGDPYACTTDAPSDGPDPPKTPCDPASDAGACDLPPSVCVSTEWLLYYSNPQCIDGFCHWDKKAKGCCCPGCDCANGGCQSNLTK